MKLLADISRNPAFFALATTGVLVMFGGRIIANNAILGMREEVRRNPELKNQVGPFGERAFKLYRKNYKNGLYYRRLKLAWILFPVGLAIMMSGFLTLY